MKGARGDASDRSRAQQLLGEINALDDDQRLTKDEAQRLRALVQSGQLGDPQRSLPVEHVRAARRRLRGRASEHDQPVVGPSADTAAARDSVGAGPASFTSTRTATPHWVRVSWTITAVVVVVFLITLVAKGPHRPGGRGHALSASTTSIPLASAPARPTPGAGNRL